MTKRGNETIEYNVFNKPVRITGTTTTVFDYGANHELFRETAGSAITYRFEGGLYEEIVEGTKTTQKSYVDGVILNTRTLNSGVLASNDTVYLHSDNLGSIEATSSKLGQFVNRMSFSDWGKRQLSDWKTGSPTDVFATADGYTGHHQLDQHKLVHMGGRVYDPGLGRFLSADLFVQSPYSSQSFNRYTYVSNNPMSKVDPTGYLDIPDFLVKGYRDDSNPFMDTMLNDMYYGSRGGSGSSNIPTVIDSPLMPNLSDKQSADTNKESVADNANYDPDAAFTLDGSKKPEILMGALPDTRLAALMLIAGTKQLSKQVEKGIRSLTKQINAHEKKIADFKANPTVRPGMEGQPQKLIEAQQQSRISHLEKEIDTFINNIRKLLE